MKKLIISAVCLVLIIPGMLFPQIRECVIEKLPGEKPKLDGRLDEPFWNNGGWIGDFVQYEPLNGADPEFGTEFKMYHDDENIFIGIKAYDKNPDEITARIARRDAWEGDLIEVHFDSYNDKRTSFVFSINAAGSIGDNIMFDDGNSKILHWNPVWEGKALVNGSGWTAEMRIPLSQLRFDDTGTGEWGFQFVRWVHRTQEFSTWQPVSKEQFGWTSTFGRVKGVSGLQSRKRIEVIPYTVGKYSARPDEVTDNIVLSESEGDFYGGVDAKVEITKDFNLDLTVNPDFGQVEADPSEINLTAFETFFPEKRQFFVEGTSIFDFGLQEITGALWQDKMFYSRRIGKGPGTLPDAGDGEYFNLPDKASIAGAFKLTGKTGGGMSIGILESVTTSETADFLGSGETRRFEVIPLTNYFAGRVQQDYDNGNMSFGGMVTAVNRDLGHDYQDFMNRSAYTGAVDFMKMWNDKTYSLKIKAYGSRIAGSKEAISRAQKSSMRYYQRPDADYIEFDPDLTSLSGYGGSILLRKLQKGHWSAWIDYLWRSPGLELNDIGFLRNADFKMYNLYFQYREYNPFWIFNNYYLTTSAWYSHTYGGEKQLNGIWTGLSMQFRNFWSISLGQTSEGDEENISILRGGPAVIRPKARFYNAGISSDARRDYVFNLSFNRMAGDHDYQTNIVYRAGFTWNSSRSLFLSVQPAYQESTNKWQYLRSDSFDDMTRYTMASLSQKIFSITTRVYYNITPNLTLQYYGMPFIGSGSYSNFKHDAEVRSGDFYMRFREYTDNEISYNGALREYSVDLDGDKSADFEFSNPDFNSLQLRSNFVLRWEYQPGSTLFLVWTQDRNREVTENDNAGIFRFRENLDDLFNSDSDNIFLLKVSKWFSF